MIKRFYANSSSRNGGGVSFALVVDSKRIPLMELIAVSMAGTLFVLLGHLWNWTLERIHRGVGS